MIYTDSVGKVIDTDKEKIICIACGKEISKEDINNGNIYCDGDIDQEKGYEWQELAHSSCAEEAESKAMEWSATHQY